MARISVLVALWILVTACFAGSLVSSPPAVAPTDSCDGKAPVFTRGSLEQTSEADPVILARRNFLGYGLMDDIARVLGLIRAISPEMAEVNARPKWELGTLILGLEPSLFEAVSAGLPEEGVSSPFCTGHPEFDALNAAVGLQGVEIFPFKYALAIAIRFDPREHVYSAAASYEKIKGIIYAQPEFILGDGSDIEVRWSDGKWYVVFRKAWGDCPSGCIFSEHHFFIEYQGEVERINPERATGIEEFAQVLAERGWVRRPEGI